MDCLKGNQKKEYCRSASWRHTVNSEGVEDSTTAIGTIMALSCLQTHSVRLDLTDIPATLTLMTEL